MGHARSRGFNLPELMVALTLGLLLLAGYLAVLDRSRRLSGSNENLAQLQESARVALDALVLDAEHAGFFGLSGGGTTRLAHNGMPMLEGEALRQPEFDQRPPPAGGLPPGAHDCGTNFAIDLQLAVQGSNASWPVSPDAADCDPTAVAGGTRAGSDALVIRRASLARTTPRAGRVQIYSRSDAHGLLTLFADGLAPGPLDLAAEVRDLEVRSYYVANQSVGLATLPALRVKVLTESGGRAQFRDEEVMPGVEDLQVEFGVRGSGTESGGLTFVPPDFPGLRARHIVAIRLWLRVRAPGMERDFLDSRELQYADVTFSPDITESRQRRLLLQRTVALRNVPAS